MASSPRWLPMAMALLMVGSAAVRAQDDTAQQEAAAQEEASAEEAQGNVEDIIVVTASRAEQKLQEVPAAMTVITGEQLEKLPVDDYGDILRNVPGLNVSQMSARDIQVTGRSASSSLAAQELVLLDGRTVYLDFFGFVMWDLLPINPREIKQIEVVRGPGSAVWGANALSGVINLITRTPREMEGTSILLGGGELSTFYGSLTHARANDRGAFKFTAGYYEQDPFDRPTGLVPGTTTPYPAFENEGTEQPKVDLRYDFNPSDTHSWSFSAGYAGTDGIIHSGIGPFDIDKGTNMSYGKVSYAHNAWRVNLFANLLDGDASNLLTRDALGQPLQLGFESNTYNLDANNVTLVGNSNLLTYGANARQSEFDLTIAPQGEDRQELGVFLQDEILFGERFRWLIGARWDDLDPIGTVVSPRTTMMFSPTPDHTFRASYNRAFKAPSQIQNYLNVVIVNAACLIPGGAPDPVTCRTPRGSALLVFPSLAAGNPNLQEEQLDAYEVGWVGSFGTTDVTLSAYRNVTEDSQDFFTAAYYSNSNKPPGYPPPGVVPPGIPPQFIPVPPNTFPSLFSYRNIGKITEDGVEFSIDGHAGDSVTWGLNYSYQADPDVEGIPREQVNTPPEHRANFNLGYSGARFFASGNVNYVDEAFWTDVLDARFHGPTDSYTQLNLSLGYRFGDKVTFSIIGNNVLDEEIQQHVFGDIISRKVVGQVLIDF